MAKRSAKAKSNGIATAPKKTKPGYKICPECSAEIPARSGECKQCHHKFVPKSKKKGRKAAKAAAMSVVPATNYVNHTSRKSTTAAAHFIKEAGGIDKAIDLLTLVRNVVGSNTPF